MIVMAEFCLDLYVFLHRRFLLQLGYFDVGLSRLYLFSHQSAMGIELLSILFVFPYDTFTFPPQNFPNFFLCKYFSFGCSNLSIFFFLWKQWNWQSSHPRKMLSKFHLICADSLQPSAKYNYFLPATSFYFIRNFSGH